MPFDFDPLSRFDSAISRPFGALGFGGLPPGPEYRKEFDPEQYESLRSKLLGGAMSGLRGIGWALSTPGDYLRGAISGNLGERKSGRDILDQLGVTSKHDKGWGAWGLGLATDIATDPLTYLTMGAKHALTPAGKALAKLGPTEGGIQALSRAQRLRGFQAVESDLSAAGRTAEQIRHAGLRRPGSIATSAQEARVASELGRFLKPHEPLASLFKVQLPFGYGPQLNLGTGPWSQNIAGRLDKLGNYLSSGNMVSRGIRSILDPSVQGTMSRFSQRAEYLPGGGFDVMKAAEARGREALQPLHRGIETLLHARPNDPAYELELLRAINAIGEEAPLSHYHPDILQQAAPLGEQFHQLFAKIQPVEHAMGASTHTFETPWGQRYTYRQALHAPSAEPLERLRSMPAHMSYDVTRDPHLVVPGGTDRVNLWAEQGLTNPKLPVQGVRMQVYKDSLDDLRELKSMGVFKGDISAAIKTHLWNHSEDVALKLRSLKGMTGETLHGPVFAQNPVELASKYLTSSAKKQGALEAIYRSIGETAVPAGTHAKGEAIPVPVLLRKLGLATRVPETTASPVTGAAVKAAEALAPKGAPMASDLAKAYRPKRVNVSPFAPGSIVQPVPTAKPLINVLKRHEIPLSAAEEILGSPRIGQMPEQLKGLMGLGASATNAFRALAYPIWPASHVRNAMTAALNMLRTDTPLGAIKSIAEQFKEMRNPAFSDPALAASRATQYAHGGVGSGFGTFSEAAGMNLPQRMATGNRITPQLPMAYTLGPQGVSPTGTAVGDVANLILNEGLLGTGRAIGRTGQEIVKNRGGIRQALSENLGIKGVGGQLADTLPAVRAGWRMGENIENLFRGAQMKSLIRQGYSPAEAGRQMLKYQFDYGAHGFTPIERNIMRQVFPFYGFMRKNIPLQLETLATRPGIIGAQVAPAMQGRTQEQDFVPQYLQGNVSLPLGQPQEGKQQFISTFGLPAEEAFGQLQFNVNNPLQGLGESAMRLASQFNPLIKMPLESLTNRQFFSGRQLSDLQPTPLAHQVGSLFGTLPENQARDQLISQLLMNLPTTRFASTYGKIIDPRKTWWEKALNLGTGVRVTDVDVNKQKAIETRDALLDLMSGNPHMAKYTNVYLRPEAKAQLTPQDVEQLRMLATYQEQAAKYVEQKRREQAGLTGR